MNRNVTMKALTAALTLIGALVGTIYGITVTAQGEFNTRIEGRVDNVEQKIDAQGTSILKELGEIKQSIGRVEGQLRIK